MRRPRHALIATALLGAALLACGCYRHVVAVKGPASQNYDVHEANIQPGESMWEEPKPRVVETTVP